MTFASPLYFLVLLLIPLYIWYEWQKQKNRKEETIQVSVFDDLTAAQGFSLSSYIPHVQHALVIIALILFAFVLARPQNAHEKQDMTKKGIDIILALDVSQSMLAEDLQPNRMEAAKESIRTFIEQIQDDRLGIIIFSGKAFTQSPLTFDYSILTTYLEDISPESINQNIRGLAGTAIGDAILAAVNRFQESEDRTKVLILVTDGDANAGIDPISAAQKAAEENVTIYTIGIGSESGAPIPIVDSLGRTGYATNPDGSPLLAMFNEDSLKELAAIGGGSYFRVDDKQSFHAALQEINQLEKRDITVSTSTAYTEAFYPYLIALSIVLFLYLTLYMFVPVKR